ncbi:hypothetical protein C0J52_05563 [Blattella germanica]|nr:hypothetical protein C0J52_05563 [Blattella germanica]
MLIKKLQWIGPVIQMEKELVPLKILKYEFGGRRPAGRPRHNCRIWADDQPNALQEWERDSPKVNVWMGITKSKVYGPYMFAERTVYKVKINGLEQLRNRIFAAAEQIKPDMLARLFRATERRWELCLYLQGNHVMTIYAFDNNQISNFFYCLFNSTVLEIVLYLIYATKSSYLDESWKTDSTEVVVNVVLEIVPYIIYALVNSEIFECGIHKIQGSKMRKELQNSILSANKRLI